MSKQKFRKLIPADAIKSLEKYLQQSGAFIIYMENVVNLLGKDLPEKIKNNIEEYIKELRSYDE